MKTLKSFEKHKIDLKNSESIKGGWDSYQLVWHKPGGGSTPNNWIEYSIID